MKKFFFTLLLAGLLINSIPVSANNNALTRTDFVALINEKFNFTKFQDENFSDTDNIQFAIAKENGYYAGTPANEALPNEYLTMQDTITLLGRAYNFKITKENTSLGQANDYGEIKSYAKPYIASFFNANIIKINDDGNLNPNDTISQKQLNEIIINLDQYFESINNDNKLGDKSNNLLESLNIPVTIGVDAKLEPAFNPEITEYTLNVANDITSIEVVPTTQSYYSNVTVNGIPQHMQTPFDMFLQVGSIPLQLEQGENQVKISVVSYEGEIRDYNVNIIREDLSNIHDKFLKETYFDEESGIEMPYRLYVPEGYDKNSDEQYPIVFMLHGSGERGDDNKKQLTANIGATVWATPNVQSVQKAFVLAPQARGGGFDTGFGLTRGENGIDLSNAYTLSDDTKVAKKILDEVISIYNIDENRLYSTGVSQGAFGSWALNLEYPDLFAALIPVAGGGNPNHENIDKIVDKPIWVFHSESDFVIPESEASNIINTLEEKGSDVIYTKYDTSNYFFPMGHFSWVPAYHNDDMIEWVFKQSK